MAPHRTTAARCCSCGYVRTGRTDHWGSTIDVVGGVYPF